MKKSYYFEKFNTALRFFCLLILAFNFSLHAQQGEWTWMKGNNGNANNATYGTQGTSNPANTPQGFYEPCEWRDKQGNFWLYGGYNNSNNYSNLWKYDPATNEWTWVKGPGNTTDENAVHGTMGVPSSTNTPGGRGRGIATWVDTAGNFWLYGGRIIAGQNFSELWEYDITTNEWTWMKGPITLDANGVYGTQGVFADANHPGGRSETSATWTDAENNLWMFGGYGTGVNGNVGVMNDVWKYSIADNQWAWMRGAKNAGNNGNYGTKGITDTTNNPPARMVFTKWNDSNGDFWIFGGGDWNTELNFNDVWKYDPAENKWTWMSGPSGTDDDGNVGAYCEEDLNYIGPSRYENRACWTLECDDFWTFAGSINSNVDQNYNDLWHFNPQTLKWSIVEGSSILNQSGSYGTQGVSSPSNQPASRGGGVSWIDLDGNLWMWGGVDGQTATYNDLWRYVIDPTCPVPPTCSLLPVSSFAVSDSNVCIYTCIDFSDFSLNSPTSWQWIFPGGIPSSSTDENPTSICYDTAGIYDVTLIVTNANGSDTITQTGFITVDAQTAPPSITQINDTLFASSASFYQWFLNGSAINGATNFYYVPTVEGSYTVEVFDSGSCFAVDSIDFVFYPVSNLSVSDTKICQKFCINYDDQSLYDPVSWQWLFEGGEPSSSTEQNPTNICYNVSGIYDVTLITTNSVGSDTLTLIDYITVYSAPSPPTITQSNNILYSSFAPNYQWFTNGNAIGGATNFSFEPSAEGYYAVVVTDSNGCSASDSIYFVFTPETNLLVSDPVVCEKFCVNYTDQSLYNPTSWLWQFSGGDPSSSTNQNPTNVCYDIPGVYDVTLITTNANGSDTLTLSNYITVYPTPAIPTITQNGYTLTSSQADFYQWQLNAVDIPGATNQSYDVLQTGFYTVVVSDSNSCKNSTTLYVQITGIDQINSDFNFSIYPNPTSGSFTLETVDFISDEEILLTVTNALGQEIFSSQEKISSQDWKKEIDLTDAVSGVYFIEIAACISCTNATNVFVRKKIIIAK